MKFFVAIVLVAFVALANAADETVAAAASPTKLEQVKEIEPSANAEQQTQQARDKRGFVFGAYSAPAYTAAYSAPLVAPYAAAPVAYSYSASLPYAYRPYASYYSYPAVYV